VSGAETSSHPAGVLVIDKPRGPSSMDVIRIVRRKIGRRRSKVGHAGTLDPLASGVLVVCVGRAATREIDRLMATEKRYRADLDLSAFSTTEDAEGERREVAPPEPEPDEAAIRHLLAERFTGRIEQRPPAFSAMKVGGRRAYALARAGAAPDLPARPVVIHAIEVVTWEWPRLVLDVRCGKGTYIRSLARDIGEALGTGGLLADLRRTAVGPFTIEEAVLPDALPEPLTGETLLPVEVIAERLGTPDSGDDDAAGDLIRE